MKIINKILLLISSGIVATILSLTPKIQNYFNEEPKIKRNLEQQIHYNDSIINNYPYDNLYIIEEPKGKNWKKFLSTIKEDNSFVIFYGAEKCFPCNYAKEHVVNLAKKFKDKNFFIVNYCFLDGKGKILKDSLLNHNLNKSTFPTFVIHENNNVEEFRYTRGDLLKFLFSLYF